MLPSNAFQIVIDLAHDQIPQWLGGQWGMSGPALVVGLPTKFSVIDTTSLHSMVGVVFRSGRAGYCFAESLSEFADRDVDLDLVWGRFARELRERLQQAVGAEAKFQLLDRMLPRRMRRSFRQHSAIPAALGKLTADWFTSVGETAGLCGLTNRRLTQLFREQVGLPPKVFSRVHRLGRILACADEPGLGVERAVERGYYDQAHFAHDFRAFTGFSFSEFAGRIRPWQNHIALEDRDFAFLQDGSGRGME